MGYLEEPQSFLIWCKSEWQMPQKSTSNLTSSGPVGLQESNNISEKPTKTPQFQQDYWSFPNDKESNHILNFSYL